MTHHDDVSKAAFAAARSSDPALTLGIDVPTTHPLWQAYNAMAVDEIQRQAVTIGAGVQLLVDGLASTAVPTNAPAVLQLTDSSGAVTFTAYHRAGEPLPAGVQAQTIPSAPVAAVAPVPLPKAAPVAKEKHGNVGVISGIASLVVAGAGAGLYATVGPQLQTCEAQTSAEGGSACVAGDIGRWEASLALMGLGGAGLIGSGVVILTSDGPGIGFVGRF